MGIKERKAAEKQQMRDLILDTAMKLFVEEGYDKVTLRRIGEKIEYSPAAIYFYFRDRNEILFALMSIGFEKLDEKQRELQSIKDPMKRLRKRAEIYLSFALKNPEYYDIMFIMRGPAKKMREKKNVASGLRSFEMLRDDVQECIEAGYMIRTNAEAATIAFWSYLHGVASLIIRDRMIMIPKQRLKTVIEEVLAFTLNSVLRKPV